MIRQPISQVDPVPAEDRSTRLLEYAIAFIAIAAAGILSFVR